MQIFIPTVSCVPIAGIERETSNRQLDFPDGNDIPGDVVPHIPSETPGGGGLWPGRRTGQVCSVESSASLVEYLALVAVM